MEKIKKKVVVLGEACTGKTALIQMFCSNGTEFPKEYHMTQVSDIASKIVPLENDKDVELFFFDLSGKELYRQAVTKLIKNPDFCVMVYDSTSTESFEQLKEWASLLKKQAGSIVPGIVVSTKNDITALRAVDSKLG